MLHVDAITECPTKRIGESGLSRSEIFIRYARTGLAAPKFSRSVRVYSMIREISPQMNTVEKLSSVHYAGRHADRTYSDACDLFKWSGIPAGNLSKNDRNTFRGTLRTDDAGRPLHRDGTKSETGRVLLRWPQKRKTHRYRLPETNGGG